VDRHSLDDVRGVHGRCLSQIVRLWASPRRLVQRLVPDGR
jgi:hypothetical protein